MSSISSAARNVAAASAQIDAWQAMIDNSVRAMSGKDANGNSVELPSTGKMVELQQIIKEASANIQALNNALKEEKENKAAVWTRA